jgi:glyoxylase I family protein
MILGIHHVAISVPDMGRAKDFYCGVLGFEELSSMECDGGDPVFDAIIGLNRVSARMKMLDTGHGHIELWEYRTPKPEEKEPDHPPSDHGIAHFCLQVRDIGAEHARLSAAGMCFVGPPVYFGTMAAVYGRDPFGNIIEIFEVDVPTSLQINRISEDPEHAPRYSSR